jgi:bifunctional oligoribonuclease and PAP phosphatase NrnA
VTAAVLERRAFHEFVAAHKRFLLTTHVNPDGDGLGSEVAVAQWLRGMGKTAHSLNDSLVPAAYLFLTRTETLETFEPELAERRLGETEAVIVLDTSNRQRIGRLAPFLDRFPLPIAVVDHHVSHAGFGKVNVIEPEASSTGEIVYDLIRESGAALTRVIAEALYVALMTDTGSFRYSNTDSHAHRMAAELLSHGLDPQKIHAQVHSHASAGRLRFFGEVLSRLELLEGGRLVVLEASPEQFQAHGLSGSDTEGLVDMPRSIAGVDVVALFSEVEPGKVKVSLRSTGRIAIDQVCARLGGGGHPHAAGVLLRGTRAEARARVLPDLAQRIAAGAAPAGDAGEPAVVRASRVPSERAWEEGA